MGVGEGRSGLVFAESVRALADQSGVVDGVRNRAGVLISAAALVTSFFSGVALGDPKHLDSWGWIATGLFVAAAAVSGSILWPRKGWVFTADPTELVRLYLDNPDVTLPRMERNLSIYMGQAFAQNQKRLRRLIFWFELASVLLVFEVLSWVVDITRR